MDQNATPLMDALFEYANENKGYFCIPGHRFDRGMDEKLEAMYGRGLFRYDLTETDGLDNLMHADGCILESMQLAADLYGSDRTWFLVNGTTSGNEAMIMATVGPGDKILIPRNSHKSAAMGLILSGATPVWMMPEYIEEFGICGSVTPAVVETCLEDDPEIKAVFITSPTYHGVCSDVQSIASICHAHNVPLLVDEAHGCHLHFSDRLPMDAITSGADLVSQSTHKTGGSMTQSSMLHLRSNLVDAEAVDRSMKLVTSTSPSYVLMASLEAARHRLALHGREMMGEAIRLAELAETLLTGIDGIEVMTPASPLCFDHDKTRLVFSATKAGFKGYELQKKLWDDHRISLEMADVMALTCVITADNTEEEIRNLCSAVGEIVERGKGAGTAAGGSVDSSVNSCESRPCPGFFTVSNPALTPREAWYADTESLPLDECAGRISAEIATPYPPGIPIVCPGEIMTADVIAGLKDCIKTGRHLDGPACSDLKLFKVIAD